MEPKAGIIPCAAALWNSLTGAYMHVPTNPASRLLSQRNINSYLQLPYRLFHLKYVPLVVPYKSGFQPELGGTFIKNKTKNKLSDSFNSYITPPHNYRNSDNLLILCLLLSSILWVGEVRFKLKFTFIFITWCYRQQEC